MVCWLVSQPVNTKVRVREVAADRSRTVILDAGEKLFGERGYDSTSLQEIAAAAGLARTTPGYFFGSKERLYQAVLDRLMVDAVEELGLQPGEEESSARMDERLELMVRSFLAFLLRRPAFVRLIQRESLSEGGALQGSAAHLAAIREALRTLEKRLAWLGLENEDLRHLLISFIALSWFPVATGPLLADFGLDLTESDFLDTRARHVSRLLRHGVGGLK
jgi:TetR/AcrR family transcriptional regulator